MRKRSTLFVALLMTAATLIGCSKSSFTPEPPQKPTEPITLFATTGNRPDTKVDFDDQGTQGINLAWSTGDKFTVYAADGKCVDDFVLDDEAGQASGKFVSVNGVALDEGATYTAFYPASDAPLDEARALQNTLKQVEEPDMKHLDKKLYMEAQFTYTTKQSVSFTFKHQYAVLSFVLNKPISGYTTANGTPNGLTVRQEGVADPLLSISFNRTSWDEPVTGYAMIKPSSGDRKLVFTVTTTEMDAYQQVVSTSKTHEASKRYTAKLSSIELCKGWWLKDFSATNYPLEDNWVIVDEWPTVTGDYKGLREALTQVEKEYVRREIKLTFPNMKFVTEKALKPNPDDILYPLVAISLPKATTIWPNAFEGCRSLSSVSAPKLADVSTYAFSGCVGLKSIILLEATKIDSCAFSGCVNLASFDLPKVKSIGNHAFKGCGMSSIALPAATSIGNYAFEGCDLMSSIDLPQPTLSIGRSAFKECTALTSINLPAATSIGESAFEESSITSFYLPEATSIGGSAFKGCALTSITLPKAASIGNYAFSLCKSLSSINLPNATSIGETAFSQSLLTSIDLPEVTDVSKSAFRGCAQLTSISLPKATSIGETAFFGCINLSSISLLKVTTISEQAFYGCEIKSIHLPEAISIGGSAFKECPLTAIELPQATTISNNAFSLCETLTSITLPKAISIGSHAFYKTNLASITLPAATTISDYGFSDCAVLSSVILPAATSIGQSVFENSPKVSSLTLGTSSASLSVHQNCFSENTTFAIDLTTKHGRVVLQDEKKYWEVLNTVGSYSRHGDFKTITIRQ